MNQQRYENDVRGPFLRFIADLAPGLKKISPNFIVDPRPNKGTLMRIYRDIRFSKDKSPYKTYAAAHFWQANGKDRAAPAHFLHLEPGNSENEPEQYARQRASCLPRPPWPSQHRALFL